MKMAKTKLENVIGDTTMKMANAKGLKIKACFFEISYVVSYIYVLPAMLDDLTITTVYKVIGGLSSPVTQMNFYK